MKKRFVSFAASALTALLINATTVTALAEAYGLEVGYDGERNIATVRSRPTQTQPPIADTGYAGFEKQWTVKEKPVTNYSDEKIFTVTYSGGLSRSEFKAWWKSYDLSTIKEYAERMIAEVQNEVPGYIVTAYFSYGQYNLGSVHGSSDFTGSNFDAADPVRPCKGAQGNYDDGDGVWNTRFVKYILTNRTYTGSLVQGKENRVVEGSHPALVDTKTFDRIQPALQQRAFNLTDAEKSPSTSNLL